MCLDMWTDMRTDMCGGMCMDMCTDMRVDMCMDMWVYMCADMCTGATCLWQNSSEAATMFQSLTSYYKLCVTVA